MSPLLCRKRGNIKFSEYQRYVNCRAEFVDGKVKLTPCPVVAPALASESSVTMNALLHRERVPLRGRINVDAVDLPETLQNFE